MINFWSFRPEYKKYRKNILRIIDKSLSSGVTFFGNNLRNFEKILQENIIQILGLR